MPKRLLVVVAVVLVMSAAISAAFAQAQSSPQPPPATPGGTPTPQEQAAAEIQRKTEEEAQAVQAAKLRTRVKRYRGSTWYWRDVMSKPRMKRPFFARASRNVPRLKYLAKVWKRRAKRARYQAHHPAHLRLWMCIHRQEGSWTDNASNNPHWGGLQMGEWFMWHYAAKIRRKLGKANNWPKLMQIWVAERAYAREGHSRAWLLGQWVPTASRCI
jgi:hypothetical protein